MEMNTPNQPINPPEIPVQSQPSQLSPAYNQKGLLPIILGIIVLLLVVGGGYYFGLQRAKLIKEAQQTNPIPTVVINTQPTQTPNNEKFTITVNGENLFIDKNKLQNPDNAVMNSIEYSEMSPDKTKLALLAQGGISTYFLYLSDSSGVNIDFIGFADEVKWSNNSKYIAYTSPVTDIGPHRFSIYDINTKTTKILTDKQSENPTKYSNLLWSKDDLSILADFLSYKIPGGEKITSGKQTYLLTQFK